MLNRRIERRLIFQKELYSFFKEKNLVLRKDLILKHILSYSGNFEKNELYNKSYIITQSIVDMADDSQKKHFHEQISNYSGWIKAYLKELY